MGTPLVQTSLPELCSDMFRDSVSILTFLLKKGVSKPNKKSQIANLDN